MQRSTKVAIAVALVAASLFSLAGAQVAGAAPKPKPSADTGFTQPFAGPARYLPVAPPELTTSAQLHQPIGQKRADAVARAIGLSRKDAFTPQQYVDFITGRGVGGDPCSARLVDESVRILTNTVGRPLLSDVNGQPTPTVLASYGLFVNTSGQLESLANDDAPTKQVNKVIAPTGYLTTWSLANGAESSLEALYRSAYTIEVAFGFASQQQSEPAQLVANTKGNVTTEVGMSMVPSIWIVNFALLYVLNPAVAAEMPAYWAPIPANVASAILASSSGQVPYSAYASDLP